VYSMVHNDRIFHAADFGGYAPDRRHFSYFDYFALKE
jgi:hypothetical protein